MNRELAKKRLEVWLKCLNCPEDIRCYDEHLHTLCDDYDFGEDVSLEESIKVAISALSAEGEYIKKEDLLNSVTIQDSPYGDFEEKVVTIEDIEKLPVYSFSERENDYMKTVRRDCGLYE